MIFATFLLDREGGGEMEKGEGGGKNRETGEGEGKENVEDRNYRW